MHYGHVHKDFTQSLHVITFDQKKKKKGNASVAHIFILIRQHGHQVLNTMLVCYISMDFSSLSKKKTKNKSATSFVF